jgi:predicted transcriptional regulator of viral defense system
MLEQLTTRGLVIAMEKGKYLLTGLEPERILGNPLFIANQLAYPSYISYGSALHFYGLTEQVPHTVFVATTRKKRPKTFQGHHFRYVTVKPEKFFGYQREIIGDLPVLVADLEKSLIDSLDQSRYAGGMAEVAQALIAAAPDLDMDLLTDYAVRMGDRSLASRLGYLLDQQGIRLEGLPISANSILLDPRAPDVGIYDPQWQIRINRPGLQRQREGVG